MITRSLLANGSVSTVEDDRCKDDDDINCAAKGPCVIVPDANGRGATKAEMTLTLQTNKRDATRDVFMAVLYQERERETRERELRGARRRRFKSSVRVEQRRSTLPHSVV